MVRFECKGCESEYAEAVLLDGSVKNREVLIDAAEFDRDDDWLREREENHARRDGCHRPLLKFHYYLHGVVAPS